MTRRPPITRDKVFSILLDRHPRRICFHTTHAREPKRSKSPHSFGTFNVPFLETIGKVFQCQLGLELFPNKNRRGYWRSIKTEDEFTRIGAWVKEQGTRVFLRDCLEMSLALGINIETGPDGRPSGHTRLGALEARAKKTRDDEAIGELLGEFVRTIRELPYYRDARFIAAVPPRPGKVYDLPAELASRIAVELKLSDLTPEFNFGQPKLTVKDRLRDDKWDAWEKSCLTFVGRLSGCPSIILIDDKYQSGISIQFVASILRAAGAGEIYGLCAVKTWNDTDNL